MYLLWKYFALGFSALLPLINPLGSSFVFLGLVDNAPIEIYRALARRIAINTAIFFAVIELVGSSLLTFFGISLPIMQVSGGIVIAMIAWSLLNQSDSKPNTEKTDAAVPAVTEAQIANLKNKAFYPFTFPITAGPGCIVVMLTLSIHAKQPASISAMPTPQESRDPSRRPPPMECFASSPSSSSASACRSRGTASAICSRHCCCTLR
jgi:multiple antibiotic resistance protein